MYTIIIYYALVLSIASLIALACFQTNNNLKVAIDITIRIFNPFNIYQVINNSIIILQSTVFH